MPQAAISRLTHTVLGSSDINIISTDIKTAANVTLNDQQKTFVGSVLDVSLTILHGAG